MIYSIKKELVMLMSSESGWICDDCGLESVDSAIRKVLIYDKDGDYYEYHCPQCDSENITWYVEEELEE